MNWKSVVQIAKNLILTLLKKYSRDDKEKTTVYKKYESLTCIRKLAFLL